MKVRSHESAQSFLDATSAFRAATPAITSVIGSVAAGVAAGRVYEHELWLTVEDPAETVTGCAIRTAPFNLTVSDMPSEAVDALAQALLDVDEDLPGIAGPEPVVQELLAAMGYQGRARLHMRDVVRVLDVLEAPRTRVEGVARQANPGDIVRLTQLLRGFGEDTGVVMKDPVDVAIRAVAEARLWLWCVDEEVVACAGHAPLSMTPAGAVGRIGSVFTDRSHRRRGYGSAITHHVAQHLQRLCTTVLLYADAANATSNHIYEELGFTRIADLIDVTIVPDPTPKS